uniref:Uncharacterized protein n=1 Tax=Fagus sylvatica TaxID=28930 RepID=A0A2N9FQY7_FAGSY
MLGSKTRFAGDTTQFTGILVLLVKIYQIMLRDFTKDSRALCAGVSDMCSVRVSKEPGSGRPQAAHLAVHVALSWFEHFQGSKTRFAGDTMQFTGILVLLVKIYQIMLRDFTKDSRALCAGVSDMVPGPVHRVYL